MSFGIVCYVQAGLHDYDSLQLLKQYGHSGKSHVTKLVQDITVVAADRKRSNTLDNIHQGLVSDPSCVPEKSGHTSKIIFPSDIRG